MRKKAKTIVRAGSILPLLAISLMALCGLAALAIDLGMIMVAKAQAQNAADAAAFAAARTLTGGTNANTTAATANGQKVAGVNVILNQAIPPESVTIQHGAYHYDPSNQTFAPQFPPVSPDNYNLSQATITMSSGTAFARVFQLTAFNVQATAIAAHRPRDVTLALDYSGSMNNESDLWNCESYLGSLNGTSNNSDPVFPQWGFYDTTFSPLAALQCTSTDTRVGRCNISQAVGGIGPMVNDYYQNLRGTSAAGAFSAVTKWAGVDVTSTQPGGDKPQVTISSAMSGRTTGKPAITISDLIPSGGTGTAASPYVGINLWGKIATNGYTLGPNYWGMTFYAWPPDPTVTSGKSKDWRRLYFLDSGGAAWTPNNTKLFASNGVLNTPTGNYQINYKAILSWISTNLIQQSPGDGRPFPTVLRSGGVTIYDAVPTDVPASAYTWSNGNTSITDNNQRFWKEYIDYVLGVWQDPFGNVQTPGNPACSYGGDFTPGSSTGGTNISVSGPDSTVFINGLIGSATITNGGSGYTTAPTVTFSAPSSGTTATGTATISGNVVTSVTITDPGSGYTSPPPITFSGGGGTNAAGTAVLQQFTFMNPSDNPKRPRHRFWFSPMTLIQYLSDSGNLPGTTTDISMYPARLGIQGALTDIQNNHPNDLVALLMFSRPHFNGEPAEVGQFTLPVSSLSRNYSGLINSIWFPPNSSNSDVRLWDSIGIQTPRAHGDYTGNTATSYGLMLAYNQFSSNSSQLASLGLGGAGRKGAQRLLILETDGMANVSTSATFIRSVTNGTNNSYYNLGGNNASAGSADPGTDAINMATRICALVTDNTNGPGFATLTKPVTIHCVAFGAIFESTSTVSETTSAMSLLQNISSIGGTGFPASVTDSSSPYFYKLCTGTLKERQDKMRQAFSKIMDDGICIIMVK